MKLQVFLIGFIIPLVFVLHLNSCVRQERFPDGKMVICDAENRTKDKSMFISATDSSFSFNGGKKQTLQEAYRGDYSVYTVPGSKAFAFAFKLKHLAADSYFKLSVWRKSKDGLGAMVVAAKDAKLYYKATVESIERDERGWERLEMEVFIPPIGMHTNEFSFYCWNNGTDTVYFDDFTVERQKHKTYPKFEEEGLIISLDTSDYIKLYGKREEALGNGILQTSDNDWVNGIVLGDRKMMKAKMRLKGDWLDHLKGDKWSLRIKLKSNFSWKNMRTFSIQTPAARNFLLEWSSHKLYDAMDIITTSYGFVPVMVNGSNKGLYAFEEHFVKQILESRNRREGVIVKYTEDAFWQMQKIHIKTGGWASLPFYETSLIKPFSESKTLENPVLFNQFLNAQKLMHQYKYFSMPVEEIFDLDKLATYYAALDLTHARHGMGWHNQRLYYNPIIGKLEPIAFDGYTNYSKPELSIEDNMAHIVMYQEEIKAEQQLYYELFKQPKFIEKYLSSLHAISDKSFIEAILDTIKSEEIYYDSLLRIEFSHYDYDFDFFRKSAAAIREYLPQLQLELDTFLMEERTFRLEGRSYEDSTVYENTPEFFVNVYTSHRMGDSINIEIHNFFPAHIRMLGTAAKNKYVTNFFPGEHIAEPYHGGLDGKRHSIKVDSAANYLFFMLNSGFETFVVPIQKWPYPEGLTPQQELSQLVNLQDNPYLESIEGQDIYIKRDSLLVGTHLIIPEGFKVHFRPGTKMNLVNDAIFISYSPVFMKGTAGQPIYITSSDSTANGFTVLQADGTSELEYVVFDNLNTLNYKGWTLTGAVNFYESDVKISHTMFSNNHSEDALNIIRSEFSLETSNFESTFSDAFDSDFSVGDVRFTNFTRIGNDAIDFSGSQIGIYDTQINQANDKGISGGENSQLFIDNVSISQSNIGLASKDLSTVEVVNSRITDCNYGLVLLQKKPEYGPASMILRNTQLSQTRTEMLIERGSVVSIDGKEIKGDADNVSALFY